MPKISGPKRTKKKTHLKRNLVFFCSCCAAAILLFLSGFNLKSVTYTRVLGLEDEAQSPSPAEEVSFWEDFLAKSPTYFDGWVELSYLMNSLGNVEAAQVAFDKAVEINPNSEKLEGLKNLLGE
jgi:cytochrome c-type biogenesis protein CcmH/NrfG